jgi:ferredoxin
MRGIALPREVPLPVHAQPAPHTTSALTTPQRLLARVDALCDRLYGSRFNPLYQSGTIAVLCLLVLLVSGLYLLLFYRIGAPYESVERLQAQAWAGRWIRALHRYASDAAMVAVAVHAVRMYLRRRTWGPRALAWLSGLALLALTTFIAITGFVMVWDVHGRVLAVEGARWLDVLPVFSEPVSRAFTGERPMPGAFFFLNYFLHIALPLGMAVFLYLHVSHMARPALLPARPLSWAVVGGLVLLAIAAPAPLAPAADAAVRPDVVPVDWFFAFWLPVTMRLPAAWVWASLALVLACLVLVPRVARPPRIATPAASHVDERACTGCTQCTLDCPYDAISMTARTDGRPGLVARVTPDRCVSCGICAGSCGPMSVGPPGRTGRDQLSRARRFMDDRRPGPTDVVLVACSRGAGDVGTHATFEGALVYPCDCIGSLHSSVVEIFVRSGVGGVFVAGCPERDCWNREGTRWARARLLHGREAELQARVDRARVRFAEVGSGARVELAQRLHAFRRDLAGLEAPRAEDRVHVDAECEASASGASTEADAGGLQT